MKNLSKKISFLKYAGSQVLGGIKYRMMWPVRAIESERAYTPILENYNSEISEYFSSLFKIETLPNPDIIWGWGNFYSSKTDKIGLTFHTKQGRTMLNGPHVSSEIANLMTLCEEIAHRYHYHLNKNIQNPFLNCGPLTKSEKLGGIAVTQVYAEGVGKSAKLKLLGELGLNDVSEYFINITHIYGREPHLPQDIDISFVSSELLKMTDEDFYRLSSMHPFDAMSNLSPVWKNIEENLDSIADTQEGQEQLNKSYSNYPVLPKPPRDSFSISSTSIHSALSIFTNMP